MSLPNSKSQTKTQHPNPLSSKQKNKFAKCDLSTEIKEIL